MFLTSSCLIWCPTPKGKQGLFALKKPAAPVKVAKISVSWTDSSISHRELAGSLNGN